MPLSDFAVSIVSQARCISRPLAVAVDLRNPRGQLIASCWDPTQPSQLWFPMSYTLIFKVKGKLRSVMGTAFINVLSGLALNSDGGWNSPAIQVPVGEIGIKSVWDYGGNSGGFTALRLLSNSDWNLRINGAPPFTNGMPIVTSGWEAGKQNEHWTFIHTTAPYPANFDKIPYSQVRYNVFAGVSLNLSSNGLPGDTTQMTVETPNPLIEAQQFYFPYFYGTTGFPTGHALLNVASGNLAHTTGTGDGSKVNQNAFPPGDGYNIWSLGHHNDEFWAVRPLVNAHQNLNIPGNGPYKPGQGLITWNWARGHGNEIWKFMRVPAGVAVPGSEVIDNPSQEEEKQ